jgi:flagellar basal-body rod protein FlgB
VLDLRRAQHALTASNIANADTPGYKSRYIPFDRILAEAVEAPADAGRGAVSGSKMGAAGSAFDPTVIEREAPPWSLDGNSVVAEQEMVRLTENAMMYSGVSRGLSRRMAMLRFAVSDGRTG